MASVLVNAHEAIFGATRLSRFATELTVDENRDELDTTSIEDVARQRALGLHDATMGAQVRHTVAIEQALRSSRQSGTASPVLQTLNAQAAIGEDAYIWLAQSMNYNENLENGQFMTATAGFIVNEQPAEALMLANYTFISAGLTAAGSETAVTLAAVTAAYEVVVMLVQPDTEPLEGTTPTMDARIQSAALGDTGFASPVTQHTFAQIGGTAAAEVAALSGTFDSFLWRLDVTGVTGVGAKYFPLAAVGIRLKS